MAWSNLLAKNRWNKVTTSVISKIGLTDNFCWIGECQNVEWETLFTLFPNRMFPALYFIALLWIHGFWLGNTVKTKHHSSKKWASLSSSSNRYLWSHFTAAKANHYTSQPAQKITVTSLALNWQFQCLLSCKPHLLISSPLPLVDPYFQGHAKKEQKNPNFPPPLLFQFLQSLVSWLHRLTPVIHNTLARSAK